MLLGAHMSIAGGVQNAPLLAASVGCTALQIFTKSSNQWKAKPFAEGEAEAFKKNVANNGIKSVVAHDAYLINLASPDDALYKKSIEAFVEEMQRCAILGIPVLIMHPGAPLEMGDDYGIARVASAFDIIHAETADCGVHIAIEITAGQGSHIGRTFEQVAGIIKKTKKGDLLRVCFDTCHAFAAGYDLSTEEGYHDTWKQFDRIIGLDRLAAIHVNDSVKGLGSRVDRHDHIGKGAMGLT
ncbi:MAG: deoxyribonuclease IV, partial [Nitrospirota bacterium]|nr:deoxyribonuclease IV [Nitrospirota bacterium]